MRACLWALISVLALGFTSRAAEPDPRAWPTFRNGPDQRGIAASSLPAKLELLWTHSSGSRDAMVMSTAAIADGKTYVGSLNGTIQCLDLKTGKPLWSYVSRPDAKPNEFVPGFKAAITVTKDLVLAGDEDGLMHAVDRQTGKRKWTFATEAEIISSVTPFQDKLIFGSYDSKLYCLNQDGTLAWEFATADRVNSSPAISGHFTFVTGCDAHLRVVDLLTGKEEADINLDSHVIASPAVDGDMLFVGNHAGDIMAVNWKTRTRVWTHSDEQRQLPYHSSAALTDQYLIVGGHDKRLLCLDRQTGKQVWVFASKGKINSSPVVVGDRVFVGSDDGNVYGVSLRNGKEVWRHTDGRPFSASPAVADGVLVIGSESPDGKIYCFGAR